MFQPDQRRFGAIGVDGRHPAWVAGVPSLEQG